jgi:hypothetical protein
MTATAHATGHWAAAHRTALIVLLLAAAIAAVLTVVAVRMVSSAVPVPHTSTTQFQQPSTDSCHLTRPGQPC